MLEFASGSKHCVGERVPIDQFPGSVVRCREPPPLTLRTTTDPQPEADRLRVACCEVNVATNQIVTDLAYLIHLSPPCVSRMVQANNTQPAMISLSTDKGNNGPSG